MCNSVMINIRKVSLPPCQLPKVELGSAGSNPIDGAQQGFGTQRSYKVLGNLLLELVTEL